MKRKRASDIEKMCLIKKKKLYLSPVDLANTSASCPSMMTTIKSSTLATTTGPIIMENNTRNIIRHTSSVINTLKPIVKKVIVSN